MTTTIETKSFRLVSRGVRAVGQICYSDGKGYTDCQMIPGGRTAQEMIGIRFGHCGGALPAGWTATIRMFDAK